MEKKVFLRKVVRPVLIVIGLLFVAYVAYYVHTWRQIQSGELVKFLGHWYTQEELSQILPPQYTELKEPLNTTEDTYTKFRDALFNGRIEEALSYIGEKRREEFRADFNDPEILKLYLDIPPFSELMMVGDGLMENFRRNYRYYENEENTPYSISFELNQITALWEITGI